MSFLACLVLTALSGCDSGGKSPAADSPLTFERLSERLGFSSHAPLPDTLDAWRMPDGELRVKARVGLPLGTRVQVAIKTGEERKLLALGKAVVKSDGIESPPLVGESGALPVARYQFEISALFAEGWQSPEVLRATDHGKSLKGPGIVRASDGGVMFWYVKELTR